MLLSRYTITSTGIRLYDTDGTEIDIIADDALTLLAYLKRDQPKLQRIADERAMQRLRADRERITNEGAHRLQDHE